MNRNGMKNEDETKNENKRDLGDIYIRISDFG
jgi:hypothetical protein